MIVDSFKRSVLIISFCLLSLFSHSQEGVLTIKGVIEKGKDPLKNATITLLHNNSEVKSIRTDKDGIFSIEMAINKKYTINFSKDDFVTKKIFVDANVPGDRGGTWTVEFSIGLFKMYPGLDVSALKKPVTKIKYKEKDRGFGYDYLYTEKMMGKIDKILRQLEHLKEEAYRKIIRQGDDHFNKKEYAEAITYYKKALDQRPGDRYPKKQLKTARELLEEKKERQTLYEQTIARADRLFEEKSYEQARNVYGEAINYNSKKEYPRQQIRKIDEILEKLRAEKQEKQEQQRKYQEYIETADRQFDDESYTQAKSNYQNALGIFPDKNYPQQQVNKINEIIVQQQQQQQRNAQYRQMIREADDFFEQEKYVQSKNKYREALALNPEERYPQNQIDKISEILARQEQLDQQYATLISRADQAFQQENYSSARTDYVSAKEIKPAKDYPRQQIDKIDQLLAQQQAKTKKYDRIIQQADQAFQSEEYKQAKSQYSEALFIKPNEQYPKDQIDKIDQLLSERQATENNYNTAIQQADDYFDNERYELAKNAYKKALSIKPGEQYPQQQIEKIKSRLAKNQKYDEFIRQADQAFAEEDYTDSKMKYQQALNIEPNEQYPQERIKKINQLLADLEKQRQQKAKYNRLIQQADAAFDQENYSEAKSTYSEALFVKPNEQYPKDQIDKIDQILSKLQTKKENYAKAISNGDTYFDEEKYNLAKSSYQNALSIKPNEQYPQQRIDKINELLAEQARIDRQYTDLISLADRQFDGEAYRESRSKYKQALELKPSESYPKQQISKIDNILSDLAAKKEKDAKYNRLIQQADAAFDQENYSEAKSTYSEALFVKPNEQYPKDQIDKIDQLLAQQAQEAAKKQEQEKAYNEAIKQGDAMFSMEEYDQSKQSYQKALSIKPQEQYPKKQIDKINSIIAEKKAQEQAYNQAVQRGDQLFEEESYRQSKSAYNKALEMKPDATYPNNQIDKIDQILARRIAQQRKQEKLNQQYKEAVNTADQLFNAKEYDDARTVYRKAQELKPEEDYPQTQIDKIESILREQEQAREEAYDRAVARGDRMMDAEKYDNAKASYREALDLKPDADYPEDQISKIERILAQKERERKEKERIERLYAEAIEKADRLYDEDDYYNAKVHYRKALEYKPDEQYPKNRLKQIEDILEKFEEAETAEARRESSQKQAEKQQEEPELEEFNFESSQAKKQYLNRLAKEYPKGVTVENYDLGNKKIKRVIVNYDGVAIDYRKVKHSWGGTYYFRNGQNISKAVFRVETKERD